jgi:flagellar biosynthesis protein FlhG
MAKVITIASGKGGVGKTSIGLNLSLSLAGSGYKVCLFDADLGLANVNILTGLFPEAGLAEVIQKKKTLADIMIRDYNGIDIIPGSSGVEKLADLTRSQAADLVRAFLDLAAYDYFILDTSAGISAQVLSFCRASQEMVLVATPEPTSLTDAYSLLKVLSKQGPMPRVRVIINQVQTAASARKAYTKLKKTVHRFLKMSISPLGIVARDTNVPIAVVSQIPFFLLFPDTPASRCIRSAALKLARDFRRDEDIPVEAFWDQCLSLLAGPEEPAQEASIQTLQASGTSSERLQGNPGVLDARMAVLEEKMSLILEEVSQIKSLLGKDSGPDQRRGAFPNIPEPGSHEKVLDFEAWVAKRQAGVSSENS